MKIIVIYGSPRQESNTTFMAKILQKVVDPAGEAELVEVWANEARVSPCQGCCGCGRGPEHRCVITDDMEAIYGNLPGADLVILASPIYWNFVTAQAKAILDRLEACAWDIDKYFRGKLFTLVLAYRNDADNVVNLFRKMTRWAGIELATVEYRSLDPATDRDLYVWNDPGKLEEIRAAGREIRERLGRR
jgi:multimeric flavodoxin WrbA